MNGNLPTKDILPYIKPRKKRGGNNIKIIVTVISVLAVAALIFVIYRSGKALLSSFAKTTAPSETTGASDSLLKTNEPAVFPNGARRIIKKDMSAVTLGKMYDGNTDIDLFPSVYNFECVSEGKISVLVICSRGFEEYLKDVPDYIEGDYPGGNETERVDTCAKNIATKLSSLGVGALYVDVGNTSTYKSYEKAAKVVNECLKNHKDVKYIIDVRRGIYFDGEGNFVSPVFELNGKEAAQMRFCVGGSGRNVAVDLAVSDTVFSSLQKKNRFCVMPTDIKSGTLCEVGDIPVLTLEIGGAANSIDSALLSSELFCKAFSELVTYLS